MNSVEIAVGEEDRLHFAPGDLKALEAAYAAAYPGLSFEADLTLCDLETIQALNRENRGLDEPTDVLSFPTLPSLTAIQELGAQEQAVIGDIFICPEKVEMYEERLIDLTHHGLLHLLGFDHETDGVEWNKEEQRILAIAATQGLHLRGIPHDEV